MTIFNKFRKDPLYLYNYHLKRATVLAALVVLVASQRDLDLRAILVALPVLCLLVSVRFQLVAMGTLLAMGLQIFQNGLQITDLAWPVAGFVVAGLLNGLIHNMSHGNIKPPFLNNLIGELCGVVQLVGFPEWVIVHVLHHSYTDDPERDPHPPGQASFWPYMAGMRSQIQAVFGAEFFKFHGKTDHSIQSLKRMSQVSQIEHALKVAFAWLVLGPHLFAFLFAPSIVFKMLIFAWLNYSAHRNVKGQNVILNQSTGFYKILNLVTFNLYYHENHHLNPKLFNPKKFRAPDGVEERAA